MPDTSTKLTAYEAKILKSLIAVAGRNGEVEKLDFINQLETYGADFSSAWDALGALEKKGFVQGRWRWHRYEGIPIGIEKAYKPILITKKARKYWSDTELEKA